MPLLKDIRKSHSLLGLDIGGTLAKLVIALPDDEKDSSIETSIEAQVQDPAAVEAATASTRLRNIPPTFGATGQCPPSWPFAQPCADAPGDCSFCEVRHSCWAAYSCQPHQLRRATLLACGR